MASNVVNFVAVAVLCLWCAAYLWWRARRIRAQSDVRRRLDTEEERSALLREGDEQPSSIDRLIAASGLMWTPEGFMIRTFLATLLAGLLGALIGGGGLAVFLGLLGAVSLPLYARRAEKRRLALIDEQMPRALELMAMSLRAGHSLSNAVKLAAAEAPSPIGGLLKEVSAEHELGSPLSEVFRRFADRFGECEAVNTFVVAVLILERSGGNLVAVIDRIVETSRARAQYRARLNALTSRGRSSARLLGFLPAIFGAIAAAVDPAYAETLLYDPSGRALLLVVVFLWLSGLFWTRRIARPEW